MFKIKIISASIFIISLLFFSCKGRNNISTTIIDGENELQIKVDANKNSKEIHYNKTFDTRELSKAQRDSIVHHVFDSLHVGINESKER